MNINKHTISTIIFIFGLHFFSYSQEQNLKVKILYPLNTGDYWEYEESNLNYKVYRRVVGDTIMFNGVTYKIIEKSSDVSLNYYSYEYIRINSDSTEVLQYVDTVPTPTEEKIFNLQVAVGDTWKYPVYTLGGTEGFFRVDKIVSENVLGRKLEVVQINPYGAGRLNDQDFYLADSLGIYLHGYEGGYHRLKGAIINQIPYGVITAVQDNDKIDYYPRDLNLRVYPNPFNSSTIISFDVPKKQHIEILIYNVLGKKQMTLVLGIMDQGNHFIDWSGVNDQGQALSSGLYICCIIGEQGIKTAKLCILR